MEKKHDENEQQPSCFAFFSEYLGIDDLTPRASDADIKEARTRAETETGEIVRGFASYLSDGTAPLILKPDRLTDRLDLKYCVPQFGRMARKWRSVGADVRRLEQCVTPNEVVVIPRDHPTTKFTLIKVSYTGICEVEKIKSGAALKPDKMFKVKTGQMVFSQIRATDGAIGIVPPEMDGALVSGNYLVFDCGDEEETAYLWAVLRSHELRADMQSQSPGSGRYVTFWPQIKELLVPLLPEDQRRMIGRTLLDSWESEREVRRSRKGALDKIAALGVESESSIRRFKASKAPT